MKKWDGRMPSQSTAIAEDDLGRGCWTAIADIVVAGLAIIHILRCEIELWVMDVKNEIHRV